MPLLTCHKFQSRTWIVLSLKVSTSHQLLGKRPGEETAMAGHPSSEFQDLLPNVSIQWIVHWMDEVCISTRAFQRLITLDLWQIESSISLVPFFYEAVRHEEVQELLAVQTAPGTKPDDHGANPSLLSACEYEITSVIDLQAYAFQPFLRRRISLFLDWFDIAKPMLSTKSCEVKFSLHENAVIITCIFKIFLFSNAHMW